MIISGNLPQIKSFWKGIRLRAVTCEYLLLLMVAFLCHRGRMTAQAVGLSIASKRRHRGNVSRFLSRARLTNLRKRLTARLLSQERPRGQSARRPYVLIIDTTHVTQQGHKTENTFSTRNRNRRPAKRRRHSNHRRSPHSSHAHVFGLLITPRGTRIPYYLPFYTQAYCEQRRWVHRTQADLAAEIIRSLQIPAAARLLVLGDTAFESRQVRDACRERGASWIMPANPERVLEGKTARAKLWSLAKHLTADQLATIRLKLTDPKWAVYRRLSACRRESRKPWATYYVHRERRLVHNIGDVQIVFSTKQLPPSGQPVRRNQTKLLLTNDLRLSTREIIGFYALRWQIELLFKEMKSTLGLDQYRFREFDSVVNWVEAASITLLYLEWQRRKKLRQRKLTKQERKWWTSQRTYGLSLAVLQRLERDELRQIQRCANTETGLRRLRRLLQDALPPEYAMAL